MVLYSYAWIVFSGLHLCCNSVIWNQCKMCFGNESRRIHTGSAGVWVLLWMVWITLLLVLVHMWKQNSLSAKEQWRESLRSLPIERITERKNNDQKLVETTFALRKINYTGYPWKFQSCVTCCCKCLSGILLFKNCY